jgi:hypothetical protein
MSVTALLRGYEHASVTENKRGCASITRGQDKARWMLLNRSSLRTSPAAGRSGANPSEEINSKVCG